MCIIKLESFIIDQRVANNAINVYLIDEYHHHDLSTTENIRIAKYLINNTNVVLVGIEGYTGGLHYDLDTQAYDRFDYTIPEINENNRNTNYTVFCDNLSNENVTRIGIDSQGLSNQLELECNTTEELRDHRNQLYRSIHFIKLIFTEYRRRELFGNLIINCGSDHNDHIISLIDENIINLIAGFNANYYRIRALTHPGRI